MMELSVLRDSAMIDALERALREDIGTGDVTTRFTVAPDMQGRGVFTAKAHGVLAGIEVAAAVLKLVDDRLRFHRAVPDGNPVMRGMTVATVEGPLASMLTAERVALNFLQRMSGIATLTSAFVKLVEDTTAKIVDTRKTAPGLRAFDKWAVRLGRGHNHRFGLDDMIMIKDNHIEAAGGIQEAVRLCLMNLPQDRSIKIEVETKNLREVGEVLGCDGVDQIMLDNFMLEEMSLAVGMIRRHKPEMVIEASGGVTLETVRAIAETGVDVISVGALTHSVEALDISFNVQRIK